MAMQCDVIIERDSDGIFVASAPQLPGCRTQASSLDELMVRAEEAIRLCLEVEGAPDQPLELVGVQREATAA